MNSRSYQPGFKKYFGEKLANLLHKTTEEEIRQVYDDWSGDYDKDVVLAAGGVYQKELAEYLDEAMKQNFQKMAKDCIKIIDVGAGTGLIGVELLKRGYTDLCALDISPEMLNEAKKKRVYKKFICAALSDQQISEIETGEFDALICGGALFKAHIRSSAFEEIIRMIKNGGLLCFNIRDNKLDDYQGKILELEKAGRWENVSKKTVSYFEKKRHAKRNLSIRVQSSQELTNCEL